MNTLIVVVLVAYAGLLICFMILAVCRSNQLVRLKIINKKLLDLLDAACKSVEGEANWDKEPYSTWYYKAHDVVANMKTKKN